MDKKLYVDTLEQHAQANKRPYEMALNDFLDFLLEFWTEDALAGGPDRYAAHIRNMAAKDPAYTGLCLRWMADVTDAMDHGQWLDAFGTLYEEMYLLRGKAAKTGQFFTPQNVSDLCADILNNGVTKGKVNDPAAGSGRMLLAHYMAKSKFDHQAGRRFEYVAQDVDPTACKMCALNLMAHGLYGHVECRDTLTMSAPTVVYIINEVRYPISSPYYSIRTVSPQTGKAGK